MKIESKTIQKNQTKTIQKIRKQVTDYKKKIAKDKCYPKYTNS